MSSHGTASADPPTSSQLASSSPTGNGFAKPPNPASKSQLNTLDPPPASNPQQPQSPSSEPFSPATTSSAHTGTSTEAVDHALASSSQSNVRPSTSPTASKPNSLSHSSTLATIPSSSAPKPRPPPLQHRHTLEAPRKFSSPRPSRDHQSPTSVVSEDIGYSSGRSSRRRGSLTLVRRVTRSLQPDPPPEDASLDEDAQRWADTIRSRRSARRRRKDDDEDDDRVVVGTKVDQHHVNWITAYNMLTGIRFTVSRTNAKLREGELTSEHFEARHKFSFDVTGNVLMPTTKYDFKFKDYAPEVFRELRSIFNIDPANYLVSLTSKYILSELGSPGKSGGFFYFSRDYKYIIKTIHAGEHRLLRKVLRDYYNHVKANPDTLLSQFYGLHRVKIPYGKKIHFVVMNNLFPPHRDIHRIFDLKGSTVGRDFKEEDLDAHPRATLKDLNWIRRNLYIELGNSRKQAFIEQMKKDVALLKRLKIMDYSLLVGIHDLGKGNEENLRDKTLRVFEPHEDTDVDPPRVLNRSESKLENVRKIRELRQNLKSQKPVPVGTSSARMPDEIPHHMTKTSMFYSDDGGFRATHEDDSPGDEIYYLGIIDCLTKYNIIKRSEHFIKSFTAPEPQISAIPPDRYGNRFVKFINDYTVPAERVPGRSMDWGQSREGTADSQEQPDRERRTFDSVSADGGTTTLPVVQEAPETASPGEKNENNLEPNGTGTNDAAPATSASPEEKAG